MLRLATSQEHASGPKVPSSSIDTTRIGRDPRRSPSENQRLAPGACELVHRPGAITRPDLGPSREVEMSGSRVINVLAVSYLVVAAAVHVLPLVVFAAFLAGVR